MSFIKRLLPLAAIVAFALMATGCASDDSTDTTAPADIAATCLEGTVDCNDTPNGDLPPDVLPPNGDDEPVAGPDISESVSVQQARDHVGSEPIAVNGFYLDDGQSARLCEMSLESYPPQCGGASLVVTNPELMTDFPLVEEAGTQWSQDFVVVEGTVAGDRFTIVAP